MYAKRKLIYLLHNEYLINKDNKQSDLMNELQMKDIQMQATSKGHQLTTKQVLLD